MESLTNIDIEMIRKYLKPNNYAEYREGLEWFTNKVGEQVAETFNQYILEVKYIGVNK